MKLFGFEITVTRLPSKKKRIDALEKQMSLMAKNLDALTKILENGNK